MPSLLFAPPGLLGTAGRPLVLVGTLVVIRDPSSRGPSFVAVEGFDGFLGRGGGGGSDDWASGPGPKPKPGPGLAPTEREREKPARPKPAAADWGVRLPPCVAAAPATREEVGLSCLGA